MNPTHARNSIPEIAKSKGWIAAITVAEQIDDPWFRCQAIAMATSFVPNRDQQLKLLNDALKAADSIGEPNRIVSVSAWPVAAMIKLGFEDEAEQEVSKLLGIIHREPSPVRRADALNLLCGMIFEATGEICLPVYDALFSSCTTTLTSGKKNSKGEGVLSHWAGHVSKHDPRRGQQLLDSLKGSVHKKNAQLAIEARQ